MCFVFVLYLLLPILLLLVLLTLAIWVASGTAFAVSVTVAAGVAGVASAAWFPLLLPVSVLVALLLRVLGGQPRLPPPWVLRSARCSVVNRCARWSAEVSRITSLCLALGCFGIASTSFASIAFVAAWLFLASVALVLLPYLLCCCVLSLGCFCCFSVLLVSVLLQCCRLLPFFDILLVGL